MKVLTTFLTFLTISGIAFSATIYVPDDYATIQEAINASSNDDTVIVRSGTYYENIDFLGKAIVLKSEQGPSSTTIDGLQNGSVVVFVTGEGQGSLIEGFTIANGSGTQVGGGLRGGGIYCFESSPVISGNVITGNNADRGGGVSCNLFANAQINNNTVSNNTALMGGGFHLYEAHGTVTGNSIIDNHATDRGGAMYFADSSVEISYNVVSGNSSDYLGGGITAASIGKSPPDPVRIHHNLITDNSTLNWGGGLYIVYKAEITHNTICHNSAHVGAGIHCQGSDSDIVDISYNSIFENTSAGYYGGGIYCSFLDARIAYNRIYANIARTGGGINIERRALVLGNHISNNEASESGGGIYAIGASDLEITNNIIDGNSSSESGGGVYFFATRGLFTNNTVVGNTALNGGGMDCRNSSSIEIFNSILFENTATTGKEIHVYHEYNPVEVSIDYSDPQGGLASVYVKSGSTLHWGSHMLDAVPGFVDPYSNDFHLTLQSPCRNTGDATAPGLPDADFEGDPRIAGSGVDMGSDEFYYHLYNVGDIIPGESINIRVVGWPDACTKILLGSGIKDPPQPTMYGDFHLEGPITVIHIGFIPSNGVIDYPATVPVSWQSGEVHPFQAFIGGFGWPSSRVSNLLTLTVE